MTKVWLKIWKNHHTNVNANTITTKVYKERQCAEILSLFLSRNQTPKNLTSNWFNYSVLPDYSLRPKDYFSPNFSPSLKSTPMTPRRWRQKMTNFLFPFSSRRCKRLEVEMIVATVNRERGENSKNLRREVIFPLWEWTLKCKFSKFKEKIR